MAEIVEKSASKAPSYHKQLTMWVHSIDEILFATEQFDKYRAPWVIKREQGQYAVFVPGEKDSDPIGVSV